MRKQYQVVSAADAVKVIKSGDHVHIISVAHPKYQEMLDEAAFKRFGPHYHYVCKNI